MRKNAILTIVFTIFYLCISNAVAHNQVVVVPLGGKGYEPQNPLVIPASEFRPDGLFPGSTYFYTAQGYIRGNGSAAYGCVVAPVYLPDGVTITLLLALVNDNDLSNNMSVNLRRSSISLPTDSPSILATASTSGANISNQNIWDPTINNPQVDVERYTYYVDTCLSSNLFLLYGVKVYYIK